MSTTSEPLSADFAQVQAHYDLSNEFFGLFLDPSMTYSCAKFDTPQTTLVEAQATDRIAIGSDVSSLAVFVSRAKTTLYTDADVAEVCNWAADTKGLRMARVPSADRPLTTVSRSSARGSAIGPLAMPFLKPSPKSART